MRACLRCKAETATARCTACGADPATGKRPTVTAAITSGLVIFGAIGLAIAGTRGSSTAGEPSAEELAYVEQHEPSWESEAATPAAGPGDGATGSKDSTRSGGQYAMRRTTPEPALGAAVAELQAGAPEGAAARPEEEAPSAEDNTPPEVDPCARAKDPASGAPLVRALAGLKVRAARAADGTVYAPAVTAAEEAIQLSPECADAWGALAFASYRGAYDICGRGDYARALEAARKAEDLATTPDAHAAAQRNEGRIHASMLAWDEAEVTFRRAQAGAPLNKEAQSWLDSLAIRKAPRPALVALIKRVLAGETILVEELEGFTAPELSFAANGALVKHGRRLNAAPVDWFYYCDGSPLDPRPTMDPTAASAPVPRGSVDLANQRLLDATARKKKGAAGPSTP